MKFTAFSIIAAIPLLAISETMQQRFASESNMCARLSQGLGLKETTNRVDWTKWETPTNVVFDGLNWGVEENDSDEYDNCRLISLSLHVGTTNATAEVRLCEDPETALFATMFSEVAFSSMSPFKLIPNYVLEKKGSGVQHLYRKRDSGPDSSEEPDYGNFDFLLGNASVYVHGPSDFREFPLALLRAGGVEIPDEDESPAP